MQKIRNLRELGIAVRGARQETGMTQAELCQKANVSRRWLIALENGETASPDASKIFDTLRALGLTFGIDQPAVSITPNHMAREALEVLEESDDQDA